MGQNPYLSFKRIMLTEILAEVDQEEVSKGTFAIPKINERERERERERVPKPVNTCTTSVQMN